MTLLIGKTNVTSLIQRALAKQKAKFLIFELPAEQYFDINAETVKLLLSAGYSGLYISLHRPYPNLLSSLKAKGVNVSKLLFIDGASSQAEVRGAESEKCTYISNELNVDELTRAIYKMLPKLKGDTFVFLDSITTLVLYQPLSEALRFTEFLNRTVSNGEVNGVVVNVARDLAQKKFVKDIMLHVDDVIKIGGGK